MGIRTSTDAQLAQADGRVLETRCDGQRGPRGTLPISEAEHPVKIRDCLATRLDAAAAERIIELAGASMFSMPQS